MQLRVARLCLDCEELHSETRCPRCASESYAFLSTWLPVDERRKWRRPAAEAARTNAREASSIVQAIARWFRGESVPAISSPPATRRSDAVAQMKLDDLVKPGAEGSPEQTAGQADGRITSSFDSPSRARSSAG